MRRLDDLLDGWRDEWDFTHETRVALREDLEAFRAAEREDAVTAIEALYREQPMHLMGARWVEVDSVLALFRAEGEER